MIRSVVMRRPSGRVAPLSNAKHSFAGAEFAAVIRGDGEHVGFRVVVEVRDGGLGEEIHHFRIARADLSAAFLRVMLRVAFFLDLGKPLGVFLAVDVRRHDAVPMVFMTHFDRVPQAQAKTKHVVGLAFRRLGELTIRPIRSIHEMHGLDAQVLPWWDDRSEVIVPGEEHVVVTFEKLVGAVQGSRLHSHACRHLVGAFLRRVTADDMNVLPDGADAESLGREIVGVDSGFFGPRITSEEDCGFPGFRLADTKRFDPGGPLDEHAVFLERLHGRRFRLIIRQAEHVVNRLAVFHQHDVEILGHQWGGGLCRLGFLHRCSRCF